MHRATSNPEKSLGEGPQDPRHTPDGLPTRVKQSYSSFNCTGREGKEVPPAGALGLPCGTWGFPRIAELGTRKALEKVESWGPLP